MFVRPHHLLDAIKTRTCLTAINSPVSLSMATNTLP